MKYEDLKEILDKTYEKQVEYNFPDDCIYAASICFQNGHPLPKGVVSYNQVVVKFKDGEKKHFPLDPLHVKEAPFTKIYDLILKVPHVHEKDMMALKKMDQKIKDMNTLIEAGCKDKDEHVETIRLMENSKNDLLEKLAEMTGLDRYTIEAQYWDWKRKNGD